MRGSKLDRTVIAEGLVRPAGVVPGEPTPEALLGLSKIRKLMLPDALLFETPKEALNHAILLRRVRRDEFLRQPVVATGSAEAAALKDQPLSLRTIGTAPWGRNVPNRERQAASSARSASLARPRKAKS